MATTADLLRLNRRGELGRERDVGDGYVVQDDVEPQRAPHEVLADEAGDHLALGDELARVELGDDALEDLVDDRRQHALVVVLPELAVDGRERGDGRPREHPAADVDHLQVCDKRLLVIVGAGPAEGRTKEEEEEEHLSCP
jgi:hypothetical protein